MTKILPKTNLQDHAIRNILNRGGGRTDNDFGSKYRSAAVVNDNSRYKPISYPKLFKLTDEDFYAADWGYIIPTYSNYIKMKEAIEKGETWGYNRPYGGESSPYRSSDFRGYDAEAKPPFAMNASNGENVYLGNSLRLTFNEELTDIVKWSKFSSYQGTNIQYLNCGVYVPEIGYYYALTDTNQGLTMYDLDWEKINISIPSNLFKTNTTYTAYFVLTTFDGVNGGHTWYYPSESDYGSWWVMKKGGEVKFKVVDTPTPMDYINVYGYGNGSYSYISGYYSISGVTMTFEIETTSSLGSTSGTLSVEVVIPNHYDGGNTVSPKTIASFSLSGVSSNYKTTKTISGSSFNLLTSKEDSVNASVVLTYTVGTKIYTETRNAIIELTEV